MAKLNDGGFLDAKGDYRDLIFYKKTKILFDMTYWYKERYLERGDRTQDQMQQAARSGKQNIAEGTEDGLEEFCNVALTLIHQADRGMWNWIRKKEKNFLEEGGIREKMSAARKNQRGY